MHGKMLTLRELRGEELLEVSEEQYIPVLFEVKIDWFENCELATLMVVDVELVLLCSFIEMELEE